MYIAKFGGSWLDHPFWFSRFVVKPADVARINQAEIPSVVIDDEKGIGPDTPRVPEPKAAEPTPITVVPKPARPSPIGQPPRRGPVFEPWRRKSDRERAQELVAESLVTMRRACSDVRLGRAVRMPEITSLVDEVIEMVERPPRTLLDILRLKKKDEYTYLHSVAVCTLMVNVARHLGRSEEDVRDFGMAGLLHDIGKLGVSNSVLDKNGKPDEDEWAEIKRHPELGRGILSKIAAFQDMARIAGDHHEKLDGRGYPHGIKAEAIDLDTRIVTVADIFDALTADRPYRKAMPVSAA